MEESAQQVSQVPSSWKNHLIILFGVVVLFVALALSFLFFLKPKKGSVTGQDGQTIQETISNLPLQEGSQEEISGHLESAATSSVEDNKFSYYTAAFSQLQGQYYANPTTETLEALKNLRDFINQNFPKDYEQRRQRGLAIGSDPWEIKEK